ncbi:hypothetical protein BV25DRAFT_1029157 [Artomyces pyxidatus]|uniref:Uncharacterized protein n=1 Tax=Artomyces pyxidatus TaxID=48021 RepID=A0ACB8SVX6_9AGAM|nr:hypothetical protein BV25DRAFT_1029157 [Artomyces pyxidatus]
MPTRRESLPHRLPHPHPDSFPSHSATFSPPPRRGPAKKISEISRALYSSHTVSQCLCAAGHLLLLAYGRGWHNDAERDNSCFFAHIHIPGRDRQPLARIPRPCWRRRLKQATQCCGIAGRSFVKNGRCGQKKIFAGHRGFEVIPGVLCAAFARLHRIRANV